MKNRKENEPLISIVMSVKNGSLSLDKCLNSILNQTFAKWEFIICDDGSSDDSLRILHRYASEDSRFVILHNETNMGLAYSLNRCISFSKSNILARQDCDDYSDIHRFERQYDFIVRHPEYAIVGTYWSNVDEFGNITKKEILCQPTVDDMIRGGVFMHPTWMMQKNLLEKVGFYTVNKYTMRSQDYHLVLKLFGEGMKIYNMPEFLYFYSADSSTINRSKVSLRNMKRIKALMWIRFDGYKRNHVSIWKYIYVLKPLLIALIPQFVLNNYYRSVYGKA